MPVVFYHSVIHGLGFFICYTLNTKSCFVSLEAEKDKEVIARLQKVLMEQDHTLTEQGQALDERQNEIETLTTELQGWQEKCDLTTKELEKKKEEISGVKKQALVESEENKRLESQMKDLSSKQESTEQNANARLNQMEEEIRKLKQDRACFEAQLEKKDEEIRKAHDSRENIMKTMREALEVAKANKAEYEIKLATIREQCRQELKREMDEELRRTKRDFQRQLNDKDKSLEEIKNEKESVEKALAAERAETSKTDSSTSVKQTVIVMCICLRSTPRKDVRWYNETSPLRHFYSRGPCMQETQTLFPKKQIDM